MVISGEKFNGYKIPENPNKTTNFNITYYCELDIISSIFRGKILSVNVGPDSDNMKFFHLRIDGIGKVDKKYGYYDDAQLIWGKWTDQKDSDANTEPNPKNDFIGFVHGMDGKVRIHAQLHPEKYAN